MLSVERLHTLVKVLVRLEACVLSIEDALVDGLVLIGQQPQVVFFSLGVRGWGEGLKLVRHALDDEVVRFDALVLNNICSFLGSAARTEHNEDGCMK